MHIVNTKNATMNPYYSDFQKTWLKMRDVFKGGEHMKTRALEQNLLNLEGTTELRAIRTFDQYLRPTDSMRRLGNLGLQRFCDYIYRANFYPFPLEIQSQSLGLIENEPASFELPTQLEFMLVDSTTNNESLEKVLSIVNRQQLQVSRIGLLLNPSKESKQFNIGMFHAESILDWNKVVGEDSETSFNWLKLKTEDVDENDKPIYLILSIDPETRTYVQYETTSATVQYGDYWNDDDGFIPDSYVEPRVSESPLDEIPFVIINVTRLGAEIERPFLESVADASISLFRASAHLEDALYWGGESTLFTKGYGLGDDELIYVGNGATNKSNQDYAEATYATMGVDGIAPRKENTDGIFDYCVSLGVDLINKGTESGSALNIRSNVKTASLKTLALTGALGLEMLLKIGAKWISANPDEVRIVANTTFADVRYTAEDFAKFASLVQIGAMRERDLYQLQKKHNLTSAEEFEEWKDDLQIPEPPTTPQEVPPAE